MSKLKYINKNHPLTLYGVINIMDFEDSLTVTFGVLFGLCLSIIAVVIIILIIKHKLRKTNTGEQQIIIIIMTLQTS